MDIKLFEHNEKAYQQLVNVLANNQMATIDHATGTGKSFIALKYLYRNKDKKILYLSPTYPIFTQLVKNHMGKLNIDIQEFATFDHMIYRTLLGMDIEELAKKYDIIVLDEYHRCGAKEWGKKISLLLNLIKNQYPDSKVIGLTATNKRYLDNERDMNLELFGGICASRLDLADAIIQGILPAPVYINTIQSCDDRIERLRNLINQNLSYSMDREKYLSLLDELTKLKECNMPSENIFSPYIKKENGKYIVFNSTINDIAKNKRKVARWFGNCNITSYEIHSRKSNEKNEETLMNFRNSKDGINLLFVVDILNEGIHVDGIDGIIMMRHTASPIIYFQQLGRLLSYSSRLDELVVWDLVDNLKAHQVIYNLYQDVKERVSKLVVDDPQNAERYNTILSRFKIIDYTIEVTSKVDKIEQLLTRENILRIQLNSAIAILNNPNHLPVEERIKAHIDIFRLSNFITAADFIKIQDLPIMKPDVLNVSYEEFMSQLDGASCVHEKNEQLKNNIVQEFKSFISSYDRVPSVLSDDEEESSLAIKMGVILEQLSGKARKEVQELINSVSTISAYDRVYYGKRIPESKYEEFFDKLREILDNDSLLNKNVIEFLRKCQSMENLQAAYFLNRIFENRKLQIQKKSGRSLGERLIDFMKSTNGMLPRYESADSEEVKLYLEFNSQSEEYQKKYRKIAESNRFGIYNLETIEEKKIAVDAYAKELLEFINHKERYPIKHNESEKNDYAKFRAFYKLLVQFGYKKQFDQLIREKKLEREKSEKDLFVPELVQFIHDHNGEFPSSNVNDEFERRLAKKYIKYKKLFNDNDNFKIQVAVQEAKKQSSENFIDIYINFIMKNKRYALETSESPEEQEIARRYKRNEASLTAQEKERITKIYGSLNKKKLFKNTYLEILKNREKR